MLLIYTFFLLIFYVVDSKLLRVYTMPVIVIKNNRVLSIPHKTLRFRMLNEPAQIQD